MIEKDLPNLETYWLAQTCCPEIASEVSRKPASNPSSPAATWWQSQGQNPCLLMADDSL